MLVEIIDSLSAHFDDWPVNDRLFDFAKIFQSLLKSESLINHLMISIWSKIDSETSICEYQAWNWCNQTSYPEKCELFFHFSILSFPDFWTGVIMTSGNSTWVMWDESYAGKWKKSCGLFKMLWFKCINDTSNFFLYKGYGWNARCLAVIGIHIFFVF